MKFTLALGLTCVAAAIGTSAAQAQTATAAPGAATMPAQTTTNNTTATPATAVAPAAATVRNDGRLRAALGLGAGATSGNTRSTNLSLSAQAVRATDADTLTLHASSLYARSSGTTTAEQLRAGARYDYNLSPTLFAFGLANLERDKLANLSSRGVLGGGLGYHVVRDATTLFDVYGGAAFNAEKYVAATTVDGAVRSSYNYASLLLGEESQHRLSDTTSVWQRLVVYPNLRNRGEFRASFGSGLSVAMSSTMNLNVGLGYNHNSDPGLGKKKGDALLTTGISVKFD